MTYPYYVLTLHDGTVHRGLLGREVRKTLDRRSAGAAVQVVYEVRSPSGAWVRVWADEVARVEAEL